jgi:hypothetical protein
MTPIPGPFHTLQLSTDYQRQVVPGKGLTMFLSPDLAPLMGDTGPCLKISADLNTGFTVLLLLGPHYSCREWPHRGQVQPVFMYSGVTGNRLLEASLPFSLKGRWHCSLEALPKPIRAQLSTQWQKELPTEKGNNAPKRKVMHPQGQVGHAPLIKCYPSR